MWPAKNISEGHCINKLIYVFCQKREGSTWNIMKYKKNNLNFYLLLSHEKKKENFKDDAAFAEWI